MLYARGSVVAMREAERTHRRMPNLYAGEMHASNRFPAPRREVARAQRKQRVCQSYKTVLRQYRLLRRCLWQHARRTQQERWCCCARRRAACENTARHVEAHAAPRVTACSVLIGAIC